MAKKRVETPPATVPGAPKKPSTRYKWTAADTQATVDLLPYLSGAAGTATGDLTKGITEAAAGGVLPAEQAQLEAAQATSPAYAQLMTELYAKYAPELNAISNQITEQNWMQNQASLNKMLGGPGAETVAKTLELQRSVDEPFFAARDLTGSRLADLFGSIDLTGALSPTERNEIEQGLARNQLQSGTYNAPSQLAAVERGMTYGQAATNRKQQAISNLSDAISKASNFLTTSKSGIDAFKTATATVGTPNVGTSLMPGIKSSSDTLSAQYGLAGNLASNQFGLMNNLLGGQNQLTQQENAIEAGKKDWLDKVVQGTQSFANFSGGMVNAVGGGKAMCWVAREVYGEDNPQWLTYRKWLLNDAPAWFRNLYIKFGERFAAWIHNKPMLKYFIKKWMNSVTN